MKTIIATIIIIGHITYYGDKSGAYQRMTLEYNDTCKVIGVQDSVLIAEKGMDSIVSIPIGIWNGLHDTAYKGSDILVITK